MIKRTVLVLVVLMLVLVVGGCSSTTSATPAGLSCTHVTGDFSEDGCYYFIQNGTSVPCSVNFGPNGSLCQNAIGPFYDYDGITTYRCLNNQCTSHTPGNGITCSSKFLYNNLVSNGEAWEAVNQLQDQNTTQAPISTQFISTSATTVHVDFSASASINVGGSLDVLFATIYTNVHAQVNTSVSKTASTVVGNELTITIPAGGTAYGIYGVRVQVTTGLLYQENSCNGQTNYGDVQTYVPIASGWCVWLSGETPCRVVKGSLHELLRPLLLVNIA
jgi:hypothetical protein